jgi:hypothetical protein
MYLNCVKSKWNKRIYVINAGHQFVEMLNQCLPQLVRLYYVIICLFCCHHYHVISDLVFSMKSAFSGSPFRIPPMTPCTPHEDEFVFFKK